MTNRRSRRSLIVLVVLGITPLLLSSCGVWRSVMNFVTNAPPDECPHYYSRLLKKHGLADSGFAPLSQGLDNVPEYNDCQKLIDGHGTYGALGTVFASAKLSTLLADQQAASTGGLRAMGAATLLSLGSGYTPLGMQAGWNCLYLWNDPIGSTAWHARVTPSSDDGRSCATPLNPATGGGTNLRVIPRDIVPGAPYPPVARWGWSGAGEQGQHYIGILCGTAWCDIGPPGFTPAPNVVQTIGTQAIADLRTYLQTLTFDPGAGALTPQELQGRMVEGWYDDQRLSRAAGGPIASAMWSAVIPDPRLDAAGDAHFDVWRVSAYVFVPEPLLNSPAADHLNEYAAWANLGPKWSVVSMCGGTRSGSTRDVQTCLAGVPQPQRPSCNAVSSGMGEERWMARVDTPGRTKYFCLLRRKSVAPQHIVGTARWRWLAKDETGWMRCVQGCCEVEH